MSKKRVLIVHPEDTYRVMLGSMLQSLGCQIDEASNDRVAVRKLEQVVPDLVLAACDPNDPEALELLAYLRRKHPEVNCVLLFLTDNPDRMREALNWGVATVLRCPIPANTLRAAVAQSLGLTCANGNGPTRAIGSPIPGTSTDMALVSNGQGSHSPHVSTSTEFTGLIGQDPRFRQIVELAASIAPTRAPVLLVGEPGTGKTLMARTIHHHSPRSDAPIIEVDCAHLRDQLLEIELFGQALSDGRVRPGKIARAQGGTIYLHEVAALSAGLQARLLRLIQVGEYEPLDSDQTFKADVRLILATKEDLSSLVERQQFRPELYYRISVVTLNLPPLRHRAEDIVRLAEHFRERFAREIGRPVRGFTPEAIALLLNHAWPGNVLELENAVERAVVHCRSSVIEPVHLDLAPCRLERDTAVTQVSSPPSRSTPAGILPLKEALEIPERQLILQALEALNWNRQETARVLDINRTTLYKKMKKYGLLYDEPIWAN